MAPKRKYGALEAPSQPTRYGLRERTAQGKLVRVIQRLLPSLQDPFYVLGDDEVRAIITRLEARDTETLRRVSRLWKASAEYHCERSLLLQHFPWMAKIISQSSTREELNLLFRRCLYHQESLKAGLATRAVKFTGVREWHIRDSQVVWSNLEETVSSRLLRSPKASSSRKSKTMSLKVRKLVPLGYKVKYVQAISKDEILVTAEIFKTKGYLDTSRAQKLILVSLSGKTKWITDIENPSTRPAIGEASLYLITRKVPVFSDTGNSKISFIKVSLSTGSIEMDKALPISDNYYGFQPATILSEEYLVLSLEETYATWVDRYTRIQMPESAATHHIISSTTGSLLYSYNNARYSLGMAATSSITQNAVWAYGFPHTRLTQQNPYDKSWATHYIRLPNSRDLLQYDEPRTTVQLGFEGDRCLFSHLIHSKPSEIEEPESPLPSGDWDRPTYKMRTSKFGVSTAVRGTEELIVDETTEPSEVQYTPSMPSIVTLPDGDGGRRELEVKLPRSDVMRVFFRDLFGFADGYIAYHNKQQGVLLLIDFRPDW